MGEDSAWLDGIDESEVGSDKVDKSDFDLRMKHMNLEHMRLKTMRVMMENSSQQHLKLWTKLEVIKLSVQERERQNRELMLVLTLPQRLKVSDDEDNGTMPAAGFAQAPFSQVHMELEKVFLNQKVFKQAMNEYNTFLGRREKFKKNDKIRCSAACVARHCE
ncbi:hypothetical protein CRG98_018108 [Punica granatum]|uniref:Uncharacterized protein n=1 Tax=Punica granatum TaxID=22663 RepID=A0A2I0JYU6_PUNGR|nr:hypothetical protein CRG98_018108 [Punica granatum]